MSLSTGEPRSATVTADDPCEVLELSKEALAPILGRRGRRPPHSALSVSTGSMRTVSRAGR